jgi:hypothetical protein
MEHKLENLSILELNTILQSLNSITIKGSDAPFLANLLNKVNSTILKAAEIEKTPSPSKLSTPKPKS